MAKWSLIVTVVRKSWGDKVLVASIKAGAEGGTILMGRGAGVHEQQRLLGIPIEPEKEIVFSVVYSDKSETILREIVQDCELEKPGTGIAFIIPVDEVAGICHLLGET